MLWLVLVLASYAAAMPITMDITSIDQLFNSTGSMDFHETNPSHTRYGPLEEGDILKTPDDRKATGNDRLWQNKLYSFEILGEAEPNRWAIMEGISFWRDRSCVEFREVGSTSTDTRVQFVKESGCWSHVGNTARFSSSNTQKLSLGDGCLGFGTVTHEIGHSLGFYHEQSRSDRDQYVYILEENIQDGRQYNFRKASTQNHNVEYDYSSVMHYGGTFFSKNQQPTILAKDPSKQILLGNRVLPTFRDVKLMNVMYGCSNLCSSPPACNNGGYVDAQCVCRCPPNTSGADCGQVTGDYYPDSGCGGEITQSGQITSPDWPQIYPRGIDCTWWIRPSQGKIARAEFTHFGLFSRYYDQCYSDQMQIRKGGVLSAIITSCGDELENTTIQADGPDGDIIIHFKSGDFDWGMNEGFVIDVTFV